jgi:acyl dehydratase
MADPTPHRIRARNLVPDADNKIHDDDVAKQFGFGGALVPGVDLFAYLTRPFVAAWGADFLTHGSLSARFRRPVYDGDEIVATGEAATGDDWTASLLGADGEVRAVGTARRKATEVVDVDRFARAPLPATLLPVDRAIPTGRLGSVEQAVTVDDHDRYLDGIADDLSVYWDDAVLHPGALLRMANLLLMANVALGPWIHTASTCRFLGVGTVPTQLTAHGIVTGCYERNGNTYVDYDALVCGDDVPLMLAAHTAIYRLRDA